MKLLFDENLSPKMVEAPAKGHLDKARQLHQPTNSIVIEKQSGRCYRVLSKS
jgi:hypothetical protein